MYRINKSKILLFLGLTLSSVLMAESLYGGKTDLITDASNLLIRKTKSEDINANIKAAEEILANNQAGELREILKHFVALKSIVRQSSEGKLVCSSENMDSIRTMQITMKDNMHKIWPKFDETYEASRLEQIVVTISEQVGKVCFKPLVEKFNSLKPKLNYDRVRALKQFSNFKDKVYNKPYMLVERASIETPINLSEDAALDWADRFVRMNVALYGEHELCEWDPLERKEYASVEFVRDKYDDLIVETCKHFERKDLIPIVEETLKIAKSIFLYANAAPEAFVKNGLADVASNYVVCKRLENVDQSKLIENIAKNLPQAEKDFPNYSMIKYDTRRQNVKSGC